MPANPSVAIRLGMVGDDEVKATLAAVGEAGEASATRAANAYARASKDIEDALARQEKAAKQVQAIIGGANDNGGRYVGQQDAQVKAYQAYMAQQQRSAEALRNAIEPLRVAQAAYDREIATAANLLRTGAISQEEYASAVALSGKALQAARQRLLEGEEGMTRMGASGMIAEHVVRSFSDSIAAGQSPMRAFTMESGRIIEALTMWAQQTGQTEGKVGALAAFLGGPWGLAISVAVAVASTLGAKLLEGASAADQMADHQKALADIIDRTTGRLKEQSQALLLNSAAMSARDAKSAQSAAAEARQRIAASANPVAVQGSPYGGGGQIIYQDPRIVDAVNRFGRGGSADQLAQRLNEIGAASPKLKAATDAIIAQGAAFVTADRQAQQYAAQVRVLTGSAKPGDRKIALGDFAPDKPDLALADARAKLAAATTANQRAEAQATITRIEARKAYDDGAISVDEYTRKMTLADKAVNGAKASTSAASKEAREHAKALREAAKAAEDFAKVSNSWMPDLDKKNAEGAKRLVAEGTKDLTRTAGEQMKTDQRDRMAPNEQLVEQIAGQREALAISQAELATVGMSTDQRQQALDIVRATIALQAKGVDMDSDSAKEVLAGIVAQNRLNQAIERASSSMQEVRDFASQFVDDLTSGKNVVKDLQQEFIKLALLNPLKNLISGNSNAPTLGSVFGSLKSLFGAGTALSTDTSSITASLTASNAAFKVPGFASGTDYAPGGLAWVGEMGPELMNLPRGASITPAGTSRRIAQAANDQGGGTTVIINAQDAVLADTVRGWVQQGMQAAAVQGAHGGAQLARVNAAKRTRFRIPGR